LTPSQK
jgi:hypothetical protein